jgi:cytochrome c biogenesis protein CcmG/thiol:disulfide interchange protein DsbE
MTQPSSGTLERAERRIRFVHLLPLIVFVALAALFLVRLFAGDPTRIPSALVGKPAPAFSLAPLPGLLRDGKPSPGFDSESLKGNVTVVNVWASWCAPCRQEHPLLVQLGKAPGLRLVGINYKDGAENARRFLGTFGDPFAAVGVDPNGRTAIDWGVYGVPETFIVGPDGIIRHKHIGPLTPEAMPALMAKLRDAAR